MAQPSGADELSKQISKPYKLCLSNQKGGVGKTTATINVAGALAHRGHDVLLTDMGPRRDRGERQDDE